MSNFLRLLVTGASGFIGQHLCSELAAAGLKVRAAVRTRCEALLPELRSPLTRIPPQQTRKGCHLVA